MLKLRRTLSPGIVRVKQPGRNQYFTLIAWRPDTEVPFSEFRLA